MNTDILQTVFSDCPMGIAHLEIIADEQNNSTDYRFLEVNKAFLNICGLNLANISGKTASQLFPKTETTVTDWHNLFRRIGKSDKAAEFEYYLDELKQWYQVHVYYTDKQFVTLMLIDISIVKTAIREQDEKEEELIKTKANTDDTNANVTAIIEGTTDSIWAFDLNYNILYINHVFQKDFEASFGLKLEKGSNLLNALPEILRPIWKPRYDRALSNEQHTIIDEVDTAIGKLYIQVTFNPIVNKGRVIGGSCFGSNITERKQSELALEQAQKYLAEKEAQYRLIAENSTDLIYVYHLIPEPHYEYISPSCLQLTGFKPEEGYADPFFYHKFINTQAGVERFTQFLLNPTQPTSIEEEWKKVDGSLIWVEQLISRNFDENGNLISFQSTVRDITERKQTEEILRTERMRLAGIIEGTNVGTWEWNIQTGTVIYNSRWTEIIGYKLDEISSSINTWDNFTHPEDLSKSYDLLNKHFVGEMAYYESELRMMHKNGNWVWILDRGKVVSWTNDGKPLLMMGTHQDITERKHAELKLKASEENLSQLIELAPDAFVHGDNKGNIIGTNNRAVEISGYSKEELLLMNIKDFFSPEVLEDKPLRFDLLNKGITLKMERKLRRNNGDIVFIEMNSKAMPDGTYQSFIRDITECKQAEIKHNLSEKKFRELSTLMRLMTDNMPDMLWAKNLNKEFIFTNKAICNNLLNAVDTEEPLGKTDLFFALRERNSQPDNPKWHTFGEICRDSDSITLEEMKPMQFDEFGNVKGKFLFLDVYKTPLYDEKGQLIGVVGSARDITERKHAEEALKESEKMLRELNAQKDKFFSIIAHDLKSPFNSILGFSQLLVEQIKEKDFDGIEEYAKIMLHSSEHAFSLLSNLLEWSQAQSGKIEFNPEFFELIEFIENIIPIFDDVAKQKSINILRMLPHNIPIYADKHMISTVLRNFINNAIKFTNQGGKIEVAVKYVHNEVIISVKDNGIGIAKNRLEKLFRIDESESTPGTANEKGTGLGLILCKEFVEKHNGKIWVVSDEGIGSAFSFSIPAYKKL